MDTYSNTFLRFQLRMDPFGDEQAAGQYMLDAINEDTRANTTQPIAEEDAWTADSFLNMSADADEKMMTLRRRQSSAARSRMNLNYICMVTSVD